MTIWNSTYRGIYKDEILKKFQGQGIGSSVFKFVENKIKKMSIDKHYLCCNKYNYNAQKMYEK